MRTYEEVRAEQQKKYMEIFKLKDQKEITEEGRKYLDERAKREINLYDEIENAIAYDEVMRKKAREILRKTESAMTKRCCEYQKELIEFFEKKPEVMSAADRIFTMANEERMKTLSEGGIFDFTASFSPDEQGIPVIIEGNDKEKVIEIAKKNEWIKEEMLDAYIDHSWYCALGKCVERITKASKKNMKAEWEIPSLEMKVDRERLDEDDEEFDRYIGMQCVSESYLIPCLAMPIIAITIRFTEEGISAVKLNVENTFTEDDVANKMLEGKNADKIAEWIADKVDELLLKTPVESHVKFKVFYFEYTVLARKVLLEANVADEKVEESFGFEENHMSILSDEVMRRGLARALTTIVQLKLNNRHEYADIKYVQIGSKYKVSFQEMNAEYSGIDSWF